MAALEAAFEAVRQGGPAAVLIGGEAGVGKTRLISEYAAGVRAAGARVLTGGCLELGADGLPFGPFTAILRDLVREVGADQITGLLPGSSRATRELARLLPELASDQAADAASVLNGGSLTRGPAADESRARLFEEFLTLLERLAGQRPLVLVVEDAHWADRSSRDLLAFLIGYQRSLRNVLIVVTFRSDELHRTHPLRPLLAELARIDWVERTELPRLSRGQAEELAAAVLGRVPDRALTDDLYERAEGNPLFTEELLACEDGCAGIPDSLADLLQQAVRRLPEDTQELLRVASAGSGSISHSLLAKVTGRTEDELIAAIRPAVTGNVLVTTADGYAFRHALIREAVHEDLLPGEHSGVHTRFASRYRRRSGARLRRAGRRREGAPLVLGAQHDRGADQRVAGIRAGVPDGGARGAAHAARPRPGNVGPGAGRRRAHRRRSRAGAGRGGGRRPGRGEQQRGLAFVESALGQVDEETEPVRYALLLRRRYSFRHELGLDTDMEDLDRALHLVPNSLSEQARTQLLLAAAHSGCDAQGPQFRVWAEEALEAARRTGDLDSEAQALANLAMIEALPSGMAMPDSEPLRLVAQAKAAAERAGAYQPILKLVIYESHLLCGAGLYERAAMVARQGIADAERHGLARTAGAFLAINLAEPLLYLGRWDEAAEVAERALDLAPPPLTRAALWIVRAWIALARGDTGTAGRRAASSRAVLSSIRYDDQYHLPQAALDIDMALATAGQDAAIALAAEMLDRHDLSLSSPRYVWPLVVSAAIAAREVSGDGNGNAADAGALLDRLRTVAAKLEAYGPVQRAWQLSFAALDPRGGASADRTDINEETSEGAARPAGRGGRRRRRVGGARAAAPGRCRAALRRRGRTGRHGRAGGRGGPATPRGPDRGAPGRSPACRPDRGPRQPRRRRSDQGRQAREQRGPARPYRPRTRGPPACRGRAVEP